MTTSVARDAIEAALAAAGRDDITLHLFDELPSTSRWLEERARHGRADDVAHGHPPVLCVADRQSAGHGRRGREWVSVSGNVSMSLLVHLPVALADLGGLSLVTGIATAAALREATGLDIRIKWPNDLLVDGAKLGGLLIGVQDCSPAGARGPCTSVVSGIGINVVHDPRVQALGIGGTSVEAASGARDGGWSATMDRAGSSRAARDRLAGTIAARVLQAQARFAEQGWTPFADAWRAHDVLAGHDVDVHLGHETVQGRALGVDAGGALRVSIEGHERNFHGGDVSVRPRQPHATEEPRP